VISWVLNWSFWYFIFYLVGGNALACNNERVREFNGNNLNLRINPNRAKSLEERQQLIVKLQFELHKALEANEYPRTSTKGKSLPEGKQHPVIESERPTLTLLFEATRSKLKSDLSRTYKRDLKSIYRQFRDFMSPQERTGVITNITIAKIERFLSRFGSSGTYYMNKRRNLGVLFSAAGRMIDKP
jgi:hypothetical protein